MTMICGVCDQRWDDANEVHHCRAGARIRAALADTLNELTARVRQLEQDADPRTAQGDALDRWARILGFTDREPGETDGELRMRLEYEEPEDELSCGFDPGYAHGVVTFPRGGRAYTFSREDIEAAERAIAAMSAAGGIPRHMLAGTEPAGLNAFRDATQRVLDRAVEAGHLGTAVEIPELRVHDERVFAALAIGTRVRVDDKTLAWHDDVGTIKHVPGPGDAPDMYQVEMANGGTIVLHRARFALVDDMLPECAACHGSGTVALFSSLADCDRCGGSGVVS